MENIHVYCIFISDDEILLTTAKINKFNHKYWPRKSYFVISILIRNPKFCLEFKFNIHLLMIYRNSRKMKKAF